MTNFLLNNLFISFLKLFISLIELKNIDKKNTGVILKQIKKTYSELQPITTYDDSKNKPSLYP